MNVQRIDYFLYSEHICNWVIPLLLSFFYFKGELKYIGKITVSFILEHCMNNTVDGT